MVVSRPGCRVQSAKINSSCSFLNTAGLPVLQCLKTEWTNTIRGEMMLLKNMMGAVELCVATVAVTSRMFSTAYYAVDCEGCCCRIVNKYIIRIADVGTTIKQYHCAYMQALSPKCCLRLHPALVNATYKPQGCFTNAGAASKICLPHFSKERMEVA